MNARRKYKSVRSLQRGLEVLGALNRHNGASAPLLAEASGVNRSTVYRLLGTLEEMGFVRRGPSDDRYRLSPAVRQLSDGLNDDAWVSSVAGPVLREFHPRILWPMNVASFDYDAMLIRESSHQYSPFAIHHSVVGHRLPMLDSVLGLAYLAFCPEREREEILELLRASRGPDAALARDATFVREQLRRVRRQGYAAKQGLREKRIAALGVPVMRGERVFATLNMLFFRRALSIPEAAERFVPELRLAAEAIAARLRPDDLPSAAAADPSPAAVQIPEPERQSQRRPRRL